MLRFLTKTKLLLPACPKEDQWRKIYVNAGFISSSQPSEDQLTHILPSAEAEWEIVVPVNVLLISNYRTLQKMQSEKRLILADNVRNIFSKINMWCPLMQVCNGLSSWFNPEIQSCSFYWYFCKAFCILAPTHIACKTFVYFFFVVYQIQWIVQNDIKETSELPEVSFSV